MSPLTFLLIYGAIALTIAVAVGEVIHQAHMRVDRAAKARAKLSGPVVSMSKAPVKRAKRAKVLESAPF